MIIVLPYSFKNVFDTTISLSLSPLSVGHLFFFDRCSRGKDRFLSFLVRRLTRSTPTGRGGDSTAPTSVMSNSLNFLWVYLESVRTIIQPCCCPYFKIFMRIPTVATRMSPSLFSLVAPPRSRSSNGRARPGGRKRKKEDGCPIKQVSFPGPTKRGME